MDDPNSRISDNRFLYNGKELQTTGNVGFLDYGARMYDPRLARWGNTDRFAENYYRHSPYSYAAGNPIKNIDINGDSIWISNIYNDRGKLIGKEMNIEEEKY